MSRDELIIKLIEYGVIYYTETAEEELKDILKCGFKGFESYTDEELIDYLAFFKEVFGEK